MEFLGRVNELRKIKAELSREGKSSLLIYGRRRIGKTSLIEKALEDEKRTVIRFTAKPDELAGNARRLSEAWAEATDSDGFMIPDFEKLMKYISRQDFPFILIIDEYQDLRQKISSPDVVDAIFRDFIDSCTEKAKIIICGSAIRVMKSLMDISNPLYKRFSMEMYIGELESDSMDVCHRQGKIAALKAAERKAAYMVEALGKKLGGVLRIVEEGGTDGYGLAKRSNVMLSEAAAFDGFRSITNTYSVLVRFAIEE